jgi:formate dehydrogenase major subunit
MWVRSRKGEAMATTSGLVETARGSLPVELTVNGQPVSAKPGQTILEVVREHHLDDIPTLCHDPKLEPYGSCFLCVVEVKGAPRLLPSCVTRVRDGMEVTTRNERIERARRTALELLLSDHHADCSCPARSACPAGVDVQGYLGLARLGRHSEALALIRERNPLPVVCGRVCVRKCELGCRRGQVDEPVAINFVKRYVTDHAQVTDGHRITPTGKRVAVIGGGPAGLSCANFLALEGHEAVIFEAMPRLGGMLRYGIPSYRLPRAELDDEIQLILDLGVRANTGKALGRDFTIASLVTEQGFDAVFLAVGAPLGKRIGVKGEAALEGWHTALDFLRDVETQGPPKLAGTVAVVGGGNSAIDAARTALRCGAEQVSILYRRTRTEMPAHPEEVDAAESEGVKIELLVAPLEVLSKDGRVTGLRCQRMQLGEPDTSGRRRPVPIPGSEVVYACDSLVAAIGQDTDLGVIQNEPEVLRPGTSKGALIETSATTMSTRAAGVFAGGDVVLGPSTVIDAIAHGRAAAKAISGYLRTGTVAEPGREFLSRCDAFGPLPDWLFDGVDRSKRTVMPERDPEERVRDFCQVELGLSEAQAKAETARCMECGCKSVLDCELRKHATDYGIDVARFAGEVRKHRIDRTHPLVILDPNKCILCGRCVRVCADIVGISVLGFVGRGFNTVVKPAAGKPLGESACIACGACAEHCPTGSIEAKLPFAAQGPWKSRSVPSACNFCSLACPLDLHAVADGLLWATAPDRGDAGYGELCLKGRFGTGLIHGSDRLGVPLIRQGGRLVPADWDQAFLAAARVLRQRLEQDGPQSVAVMAAHRTTLEEAVLIRRFASEALGTLEVGSFGQTRRGGPRRDLDELMGETASTCLCSDLDAADLIFLAGADPAVTHPVLAMAIRRAARRGAAIVSANSSRTDLLRQGDLWLDARRGTAGIVYASMLHSLLGRRQAKGPGRHAGLEASIAMATPEAAAMLSGVSQSGIEAAVEMLRNVGRVIVIYDLDDMLERAIDDLAALATILAVIGRLGKQGQGLLLLSSDCNSEGARLAGIANPLQLEHIRTAVVMFENPLGDFRSAGLLRHLESLVVVDHHMTETARAAEVVLPGATLAETDGTVVCSDGRFIAIEKARAPVCGLTTGEVVAGLSAAAGRPLDSTDPTRLRADLAAQMGIAAADIETARNQGCSVTRPPRPWRAPASIRLDSAALDVDTFPYATLDSTLDGRLRRLGLASRR